LEEIINTVSEPVWWFSVVVMGIVINLSSAYIKEPFDRVMSNVSSWWKSKSDKAALKKEEYRTRLASDKEFMLLESMAELRQRHRSIYSLVWALLVVICVDYLEIDGWFAVFFWAVSAFMVFFSYLTFTHAALKNGEIENIRNN
jgi:hypothetical protein